MCDVARTRDAEVIRHSTYLRGRHHAPSPLVLSSVGLAFLVVASRWLAIAPGQLVEYLGDLNQTAVAKGTVTLYLDPATGRPLSTPQPLPLTIQRNLRVVESTGSWASVQETSTERVGALGPERLAQRYTLDRGTLENLADRGSYAHTTLNAIDRTGVYSINFPFSTSDGSYLLYKNETGTAYAFRRSGATPSVTARSSCRCAAGSRACPPPPRTSPSSPDGGSARR